jgi:hypothetical protein
MPVEPALVTYLGSLLTETAGTDLFEGPMPESPDACMALTHAAGEPADGRVMGASLANDGLVEQPHVQLMVRGAINDKAGPRTRALAAHAVLDGYGPGTLSAVLYHRIESLDGEPYCLGQDQNGRWRYVANYRVQKARG